MKNVILILGAVAALILAGCNKGGTSDEYNTSSGHAAGSNSMQNSGANAGTNSNTTP